MGATAPTIETTRKRIHWTATPAPAKAATEAASAVRDFAFERLRLPRVISLIRPENVASRRVAEKVGMSREREIDRGGHPYWIYALDRPEETV